jgi:hypothetical protein
MALCKSMALKEARGVCVGMGPVLIACCQRSRDRPGAGLRPS